MDNTQYFVNYKTACETFFGAHPSDWVYIKDSEFRLQAMTTSMLEFIGAASPVEVVGQNISTIIEESKVLSNTLIEKFNRQDLGIMKTKKRGVYLEIVSYKDELKIVIIHKTPVINPSTGDMVGLHVQIGNLLWPSIIKTLFKIHGTKGLLLNPKSTSDPLKDYPLNNIQHMVLFLSLNNYSYSEISLFMGVFGHSITPSQVNERLEQLKLIFHVRTKSQLIEKAIGLNFHVILPCGFFNDVVTLEISNESATIVCCDCQLGSCSVH
ncbi:MAG: hypothetical protein PHC75_02065 [Burkholderiales bacterium]|nr:hypothetical protein [Burkholderiales bacterium]